MILPVAGFGRRFSMTFVMLLVRETFLDVEEVLYHLEDGEQEPMFEMTYRGCTAASPDCGDNKATP